MFKNYLVSLFRNIIRNKFYTTLNIIGLSVGIAAAAFILLYIQDELSYDKYHENHNRIYRLEADITVNNNHQKFAKVPIPFGPAFKLEFPEIEEFVRIDFVGNTLFRYNNKEYYEEDFYFADSTIFKVFTYKFLYGNPAICLTQPNTIVLTEIIANKYFGDSNPVGEVLTTGNGSSYKITGVIDNFPGNSHFKFDALISIATETEEFSTTKPSRYWRIGTYTYLLLHEKASIGQIHEKFDDFY